MPPPPPLEIVTPITLEGSVVRLEPVRPEHASLFFNVAKDSLEDTFRWIPYPMTTLEDFERFVARAFEEQKRGESVVFATVERASGQVVGSTRYMNIDRVNRRVEIGSTWIAPRWQRTAVNTEAKFLMLQQAFEVWKTMRVELKTDALNRRSRNAILRLGAKEEGMFRKHLVTHTGRVRDTVYFSILDTEWAGVKVRLGSSEERVASLWSIALFGHCLRSLGYPATRWLVGGNSRSFASLRMTKLLGKKREASRESRVKP